MMSRISPGMAREFQSSDTSFRALRRVEIGGEIFRGQVDVDIRGETNAIDGTLVGGEPFGDGDTRRTLIVGERHPLLDRAFAVGLHTHKRSASVILQGASQNFRG